MKSFDEEVREHQAVLEIFGYRLYGWWATGTLCAAILAPGILLMVLL